MNIFEQSQCISTINVLCILPLSLLCSVFRGSSLFCFPKLTSLSSIPLWLVLSQILFDSLTRCLKEHPCNIPLTHSITEKLSSKLSFQEIWPVQFKFIPIGTGAEYQCSFNTLRTIALHRTLLYSNLLLLVDAWGVDFIIEHNAKKIVMNVSLHCSFIFCSQY